MKKLPLMFHESFKLSCKILSSSKRCEAFFLEGEDLATESIHGSSIASGEIAMNSEADLSKLVREFYTGKQLAKNMNEDISGTMFHLCTPFRVIFTVIDESFTAYTRLKIETRLQSTGCVVLNVFFKVPSNTLRHSIIKTRTAFLQNVWNCLKLNFFPNTSNKDQSEES